jgi:ubiquinone/menaquinone biosynthesis C-methylase UbiE
LLAGLHNRLVFQRRVNALVSAIDPLLPIGARVLDVGCGNGLVAKQLLELRSDLCIQGLDVLLREKPFIDVQLFNGKQLPFDDGTFDCALAGE